MTRIVERLRRANINDWLRRVWNQPRQRWAAIGVVALLLVLGGWGLWPASPPPPRARQYLAYTACLLTDDHGVTGSAAPVWAGMQDASLATHAKVQYIAVTGPQTGENAATYLATLAQHNCNLVFATGAAPAAAVPTTAPTFPRVTFYVVGKAESRANVSAVDAASPESVRGAVARIITASVKASTHS